MQLNPPEGVLAANVSYTVLMRAGIPVPLTYLSLWLGINGKSKAHPSREAAERTKDLAFRSMKAVTLGLRRDRVDAALFPPAVLWHHRIAMGRFAGVLVIVPKPMWIAGPAIDRPERTAHHPPAQRDRRDRSSQSNAWPW